MARPVAGPAKRWRGRFRKSKSAGACRRSHANRLPQASGRVADGELEVPLAPTFCEGRLTMPRTKGGPAHARKRKRVLKRAKGFRAGPGTIYRAAIEFTMRAGRYAYRDRRQKKRHFRSLWITRLGAALRERGISYNRFIPALTAAGIARNRNMLRALATADPAAFHPNVELPRPHLT